MKRFITLFMILIMISFSAGVRAAEQTYRSISLSGEDASLISRAVRAEAGGENYFIKACVTSMILNRIKDGLFPDDARSVVLEPGAFRSADRQSILEAVSDEELLEYRILTKLVYEYGIDPTCGALFCFTENDPDIEDFNVTLRVEGLVFAKP